jgi:hypothetical protein
MIKFVYYFIISLCIMADIIRKPIQMVGFGVLGAGGGFLIGASVGISILFVNNGIGYIRSGFQPDPINYKPLSVDTTQMVMLSAIMYTPIIGGVAGATFGAIV